MKKFLSLFVIILIFSSLNAQNLASKKSLSLDDNKAKVKSIKPAGLDKASRTDFFFEDFESGTLEENWTLFDADGDGDNWGTFDYGTDEINYCATSASWDGAPLTPENWLISGPIDLSSATGTTTLEYYVAAQDPDWEYEHYKLMISTVSADFFNFETILYEETLPTVGTVMEWFLRSIDITAYNGETIYLAWVHYDVTDMFRINLDDISIYENQFIDIGITGVVSPTNEEECLLTDAEEVSVTIFNFGGAETAEFDITYIVNEDVEVTETVEEPITPGTSITYTFEETIDMSAFGEYTLEFLVEMEDDENELNDYYADTVRSTDAVITVHTYSDALGDQVWTITDTNGVDVGIGGNYQWNVENWIDVCVVAANCYSFDFTGFDETGWVEVLYNGEVVGGGQVAGNSVGGFYIDEIGDGCGGTTGIFAPAEKSVNVYPNPATNKLHISGNLNGESAEIFNIQGAKMSSAKIEANTINISHLPQGIYFIKVYAQNETYQTRFVKH